MLFFGILVIGVLSWVLLNLNNIKDWFILATYNPPEIVSQLASEDTMTNYAKRLFFINKPVIENKTAFASHCPSGGNQTHVIGCYHDGDNGIFLLDVTDPNLNGIIPVTAAYEMLHAGYARLSGSERTTIDSEMWQFYLHNNLSQEIKSQMASYAVSEPGARYDELYSVLGTEVGNLPRSLENQYKLYFNDRAKIVESYNGYQAAFNSREQEIASYNSQLVSLKSQIDSNENQLSVLQTSINQQQSTLQSEQSSGNITAFNSGVPGYNALIDQYNALVQSTRAFISEYNSIVIASNTLALEEQQLVQAISSSPSEHAAK